MALKSKRQRRKETWGDYSERKFSEFKEDVAPKTRCRKCGKTMSPWDYLAGSSNPRIGAPKEDFKGKVWSGELWDRNCEVWHYFSFDFYSLKAYYHFSEDKYSSAKHSVLFDYDRSAAGAPALLLKEALIMPWEKEPKKWESGQECPKCGSGNTRSGGNYSENSILGGMCSTTFYEEYRCMACGETWKHQTDYENECTEHSKYGF